MGGGGDEGTTLTPLFSDESARTGHELHGAVVVFHFHEIRLLRHHQLNRRSLRLGHPDAGADGADGALRTYTGKKKLSCTYVRVVQQYPDGTFKLTSVANLRKKM